MIVGFDYGSSNCAMGQLSDGEIRLIPLENGKPYLPSTLYAQHNQLIVDYVNAHIACPQQKGEYQSSRQHLLAGVHAIRSDLGLSASESGLAIGRAAIEEYIDFPEEGFFVKSPKSFFGAIGLKPQQIDFFEDIACAMIMNIKKRAESAIGHALTHTVIGRPVNFQAIGGEQSNTQAVSILTRAAKRAGFKEVEFLYEPLAAGIDFEAKLNDNKNVLVVDIGGGTSDCSFVKMGPDYREKADRSHDFLAHSGKRVGGNDLDIALTYHAIMPLLGLGTELKSGLPMPNQPYWQACKINDIHLQTEFYSAQNTRLLNTMLRDVESPDLLSRLIKVQQNKLSHQLVRQGELAKIALSDSAVTSRELAFIEQGLDLNIAFSEFNDAINDNIKSMVSLAQDAIKQAGVTPDVIYLTGGSAQSPVIKSALTAALGDIPILNGDNFGSVTAGLTQWANKIYS